MADLHASSAPSESDNYLDVIQAELASDPGKRAAFEEAAQRDRLLIEMIEARGETTQSAVAKLMGTTQSAVSDLEKGRTDPRVTTLRRYAQALGLQLQLHLVPDRKDLVAEMRSTVLPGAGVTAVVTDESWVGYDTSRIEENLTGTVLTALYGSQGTLQPRSQHELAALTDLPRSAVGHAISLLHEVGWLTPAQASDDEPPRFQVKHDLGPLVGVSLSADGAHGIVTDLGLKKVVAEDFFPWASTRPNDVFEGIATLVQRLIEDLPVEKSEIVGLGITLAGLVEEGTGDVRFAPDLEHFTEQTVPILDRAPVHLEGELEKRIGITTVVSNDASALAVNEYLTDGVDQDVAVILLSRSGEGVGSGYVVNREMAHGINGVSGEIGHVIVERPGSPCRCGTDASGCLETVASAGAIIRKIAQMHPDVVDLAGASALVDQGDQVATKVFRDAGRALGQALATLVAVVGPHRLIIQGPAEFVNEYSVPSAEIFLEEISMISSPFGVKLHPVPKLLLDHSEPMAAAAVVAAQVLARPQRWVPVAQRGRNEK
ncbi:ROK family protein (plasmid) [Dermatophilaceae bacterium Sec6.4]